MNGGGESVPYPDIAEYAFLGDCHSSVLVSRDGSVDWACFRRFDAPSVFGRLLDWSAGGEFVIRPDDDARYERRYLDDTLVLETTITTDDGVATLTEALAMRPGGARQPLHLLVRVLSGVSGRVRFAIRFRPRFDYGLTDPMLRRHDQSTYSATGGAESLVLASDAVLDDDRLNHELAGMVELAEGERCRFGLLSQQAHLLDPSAIATDDVDELLEGTRRWWLDWSSSTRTGDGYAAECRRSAIVLKALTCAPTGAVAAAATTSLPEIVGGAMNWDYRFSWVRDSSLVLNALAYVGHPEVARGFRDFLLRSTAGHAHEMQIMYGVYGERLLPEVELPLDGWRRSRPVRIGNGAAHQTQLDTYGHLLDAVRVWQGEELPIAAEEADLLVEVVNLVGSRWREPDHGIWEIRGRPQHYVHSKVMCWVAVDRGIALADLLGVGAETVDRWKQLREAIRDEVMAKGVDSHRGCFVQHYGTSEVDASLLRIPLLGFV